MDHDPAHHWWKRKRLIDGLPTVRVTQRIGHVRNRPDDPRNTYSDKRAAVELHFQPDTDQDGCRAVLDNPDLMRRVAAALNHAADVLDTTQAGPKTL